MGGSVMPPVAVANEGHCSAARRLVPPCSQWVGLTNINNSLQLDESKSHPRRKDFLVALLLIIWSRVYSKRRMLHIPDMLGGCHACPVTLAMGDRWRHNAYCYWVIQQRRVDDVIFSLLLWSSVETGMVMSPLARCYCSILLPRSECFNKVMNKFDIIINKWVQHKAAHSTQHTNEFNT
jgi:hypothetical protein